MQRMLQPEIVLETGVGIGRLTDHLNREGCTYMGFEADPDWRTSPPAYPNWATPTAAQIATADLVILDSAPAYRYQEIALWGEHGKPGSVCIVHDCGNGHGPQYETHHRCRAAVMATCQPGMFLKNPRGSWMGQHR